jgi:hypothetical protein
MNIWVGLATDSRRKRNLKPFFSERVGLFLNYGFTDQRASRLRSASGSRSFWRGTVLESERLVIAQRNSATTEFLIGSIFSKDRGRS